MGGKQAEWIRSSNAFLGNRGSQSRYTRKTTNYSVLSLPEFFLSSYGFSEKKNYRIVNEPATSDTDMVKARKAHLMFMSENKQVIGLHEFRNLSETICRVLRDMNFKESDVWILRV